MTPEEGRGEANTSQFLTSGQVVGRNALFDVVPEPRGAFAVAVTKCLLLQVRRADVCRMFSDDPLLHQDYELSQGAWSARLWHVMAHPEARVNFVVSSGGGEVMTAVAEFLESLWRLSVEMAMEDKPIGRLDSSEKAKRAARLSFFKRDVSSLTNRSPSMLQNACPPQVRCDACATDLTFSRLLHCHVCFDSQLSHGSCRSWSRAALLCILWCVLSCGGRLRRSSPRSATCT